jgi:hypothetical protein
MREELERAIRELEAKLPELRRLVAMAEMQLTLSPAASALAPVLVNLLRVTDETASELRRALLDGTEVVEPEPSVESDKPEASGGGTGVPRSEAQQELENLFGGMGGEQPYWDVVPEGEPPAMPAPEPSETTNEDLGVLEAGSGWAPTTFVEAERLFRQPLWNAVRFYLEDSHETNIVVSGAMEQAARVFEASEGELNPLEVFARTAAYQVQLLLPRPEDKPERREPSEAQLFLHLELFRLERLIERKREQIDRLKASSWESGQDFFDVLARLESELADMITGFYNRRLQLGDEGDWGGADGPIGAVPKMPPPDRDPGAGRTYEEALALPRNP